MDGYEAGLCISHLDRAQILLREALLHQRPQSYGWAHAFGRERKNRDDLYKKLFRTSVGIGEERHQLQPKMDCGAISD
jgi:hypothetical protein